LNGSYANSLPVNELVLVSKMEHEFLWAGPGFKECNGLISSVEPHRDRRPMSCCVFLRPLSTLFVLGKKHLEAVVHLSQFPENRQKLDCDYEQQELDNHFLASRGQEMSYVREPHYQHGVIFFQLLSCVTISV
jgi:hypothetical protein